MLVSGPLVQAQQCPVEILLVDSRRLVRSGIVRVLSDSGYLTVSGEASSCDEAIRLARKQPPQLVLVNLPGSTVDVLDGVRKMRRQFPEIGVLVLSDESDLIIQERLLQAGIAGCLSSSCSVEELFGALDAVLKGERYISDSLARKLAERRLPGNGKTPFDQLTHRELQILLLVSEGKNTSAIARDLCLTQKTVNGYRNRLLEKLRAKTEVELMHLAARHGLVRIAQSG
jgi:two-component system invasion response regulator UvrY